MATREAKLPGLGALNSQIWTGLSGSSSAWGLAYYLSELSDKRPFVVVLPEDRSLYSFSENLHFFLQYFETRASVRILPERKTDLRPEIIPDPDFWAQRMSALFHLVQPPPNEMQITLTTIRGLAQRTIPYAVLESRFGSLSVGDEIDRDELIERFYSAGYENENLIEGPGMYSSRGAIVDIFPVHLEFPVRLEFSGDTIESIRRFDPENQRSLESIDSFDWVPSREFLLLQENQDFALRRLKEIADHRNLPPAARFALEDAITRRSFSPALIALPDIFYPETATLFELAAKETQWVAVDPFSLEREWLDSWQEMEKSEDRFQEHRILASDPRTISLGKTEALEQLNEKLVLTLSDIDLNREGMHRPVKAFSVSVHDTLRSELLHSKKSEFPLEPVVRQAESWMKELVRTVFVAENEIGVKRMLGLLGPHLPGLSQLPHISTFIEKKDVMVAVVTGSLNHGFVLQENRVNFITEADLFGEKKHTLKQRATAEDVFSSVSEMEVGDPVVHIDHGIGIYRGLSRMNIQGVENDFISLEYAEGNKLYLPIYRLNRVHRYMGGDRKKVAVDRLGGKSTWDKTKQRAKKAVEEMAKELIELYAARKIAKGYCFSPADETYLGFEAGFPFEETRDQLRAIDEVSDDLIAEKPMDRLICGDVGFGKTEVALRAAFRAVMDGKQVAVLVPTTILAQQHFETFKTRMQEYPVRVDFLSRFKSATEQKNVVTQLQEGKIDVVIGTHRLLSKDIRFRDLGLLVVDEEHRFGVKHKEKIKQYRNKVDVLTLTATPIPRTLQMSISGIRDLSVINTPPLDRKAVQTYLCRFDEPLIQGAIRKELDRKGQIYFVHNRVQTIQAMKVFLNKLVPEARIGIGHGQLSEKELEKTMTKFLHHEFDILLCTTIIESGLDIPNANTLIINRADQFGLAQLYQLRGRVGRSDRNAYAYLLVPGEDLISRDALKRLKVLKRFTELGSGLKIALHDLEIRGAGNLLGSRQSGQISAVGFELYSDLLDKEVRRLKGQKVEEEIEPDIHTDLPAFIPSTMVSDSSERFALYKRLSSLRSDSDLVEIENEFRDRFGPIPPSVKNLFDIIELKILAKNLHVASLRLTPQKAILEFTGKSADRLDSILRLIQKDSRVRLTPDNRMVLSFSEKEAALAETKKILQGIS